MSTRELERVEVMGRVANEELKLIDAAAMLQLSYRQVKRLWRRYRQKGSKGLHGPGGAQPRDPSGSVDQETAAEEDRQLRSCEPVSGKRISAGTQPAFCAGGGQAGGLSRAEAEGPRTATELPAGDRTHNYK